MAHFVRICNCSLDFSTEALLAVVNGGKCGFQLFSCSFITLHILAFVFPSIVTFLWQERSLKVSQDSIKILYFEPVVFLLIKLNQKLGSIYRCD